MKLNLIVKDGFYRGSPIKYQTLIYNFYYHLNIKVDNINFYVRENRLKERMRKWWPRK